MEEDLIAGFISLKMEKYKKLRVIILLEELVL